MKRYDKIFLAVICVLAVVAAVLQINSLATLRSNNQELQTSRDYSYNSNKAPAAVPPSSDAPATKNATDQQTQVNIKTLAKHLERYYAEIGGYPSKTDFADQAWRQANFGARDNDAYLESYSYEPAPAGCKTNDCEQFVLEARLSDGSKVTEHSLN